MEIKVDPEQINQYVAQRIIESSLGKNMTPVIDKAFKDILDGYSSPLKAMVEAAIKEAVRAALLNGWHDKIVKMVSEKLSQEVIDTIVERSVNNALKYLEQDRDYR